LAYRESGFQPTVQIAAKCPVGRYPERKNAHEPILRPACGTARRDRFHHINQRHSSTNMTDLATRLLIVDDIHPVFAEKLNEKNIAFDYLPAINKDEVLQIIHQYTGLVIRSKFRVDAAFMDAAPQLTFIARGGAGMDNIDEAYAQQKGIILLNAPEGNRNAVGEHMVGMLLGLMNN